MDVGKNDLASGAEFTPKLFTDDTDQISKDHVIDEDNFYKPEDKNLFEPGTSDGDDDFEIPAFLRKQKF